MNENFIETFNEITSLEGVRYFYHVTDNNPNNILEEGLYMVDKNIYTTAIEIPEEFKKDPIDYSLGERGSFYRKNASIILIGFDEKLNEEVVIPTTLIPDSWNHDVPPNYYIPSCYIIGYIDTTNMEIILNDNYDLGYEFGLKY